MTAKGKEDERENAGSRARKGEERRKKNWWGACERVRNARAGVPMAVGRGLRARATAGEKDGRREGAPERVIESRARDRYFIDPLYAAPYRAPTSPSPVSRDPLPPLSRATDGSWHYP